MVIPLFLKMCPNDTGFNEFAPTGLMTVQPRILNR